MAQGDLYEAGRSPPYSCYVTPPPLTPQAATAELNGPAPSQGGHQPTLTDYPENDAW